MHKRSLFLTYVKTKYVFLTSRHLPTNRDPGFFSFGHLHLQNTTLKFTVFICIKPVEDIKAPRIVHGRFYSLGVEVEHIQSPTFQVPNISYMSVPNCKVDWQIKLTLEQCRD